MTKRSVLWDKFVSKMTLLAAVLVFFRLGSKSLWLDEAFSVRLATNFGEMIRLMRVQEANMWLYYLLLHVWLKIGQNEWAVRSLSAIAAVACVPFFYQVAKKLVGEKAAKLATPLLLVNTLYVYYAQTARGYSLMLLGVLVATYFYLQSNLAGWIVAGALAVYSHIYAGFVVGVEVIFRKKWIRGLVIIGLVLLPLAVVPAFKARTTAWEGRPTLVNLGAVFVTLAGDEAWLVPVYGIVMGVIFWKKRQKVVKSRELKFLLAWLFVPVVTAFGISLVARPIFTSMYFLEVLPAFVMLAGWAISQLQPRLQKAVYIGVLAVAGLRLLGWYGGGNWHWVIGNNIEDWRGAARIVAQKSEPQDGIIFYAYYSRVPFEYYWSKYAGPKAQVLEIASAPYLLGGGGPMPEPDVKLIDGLESRFGKIWLVLGHNNFAYLGRRTQWHEVETELGKNYKLARVYKDADISVEEWVRDL